MKNYLIATPLLLGSFAAPSFADESNDFYLRIGGGLAFPSDVKGDETVGGVVYNGTFEVDNAGIFSVGFGKEFNDYRLEFEYSSSNIEIG